MISLSGADVGSVGTQLNVGAAQPVEQTNLLPDYVVLAPAGTTFDADTNMPIPADFDNSFALIVNQNFPGGGIISAISMTIRVNAVDYDYICHYPQASSADCGSGISLDLDARTLSLSNVEVENQDNFNILTLNGSVSW